MRMMRRKTRSFFISDVAAFFTSVRVPPGKIRPGPRGPLRAQGEERVQTFLQVLDDGHDVHVRRVVQCLRTVPSQTIAKPRR